MIREGPGEREEKNITGGGEGGYKHLICTLFFKTPCGPMTC
jgi:hypothetical protein